MFIGIGTLLVAKHPAMRSLGEVTVVGMVSVVLMAYLFPPLLFKWLTRRSDGSIRPYPVTLGSVLTGRYDFNRSEIRRKKLNQTELAYAMECVMGRYLYKGERSRPPPGRP